jgi:hypothetical protein
MNVVPTKINTHIVVLLLLIHPYYTKAIPFLQYQNYFDTLNPSHYSKHCSLIHAAQKIHGCALVAYYYVRYKKTNVNKAISLIQDNLKNFEQSLIALEQESLIAIKKKYCIDNEIWHKCLTTIESVKNSYNKSLLQGYPNTNHDPNIPADTLKILTTLLQQNNINPKSIHIKMVSDQNQINQNPHTIALVESFIMSTTIGKQKNLSIKPTYIPASIEIFPQINNQPYIEKIGYYAHEIEHLIQQHSLTILILEEYLDHYYGITPEQFKQSTQYHKLSQNQEAQAEIFAAIKNPYIADCLTTIRKKYPYPNHLYQKHFYQLSTISKLWKVQQWLEFFTKK